MRNTTAAASRWLRDSSIFRPPNITSSMIPEVRPKIARYSSQTPSIPAATIASSSHVEGSRRGWASAAARQPISAAVSAVSHQGARKACGAMTIARPAASSAMSRAPMGRCSGEADWAALTGCTCAPQLPSYKASASRQAARCSSPRPGTMSRPARRRP